MPTATTTISNDNDDTAITEQTAPTEAKIGGQLLSVEGIMMLIIAIIFDIAGIICLFLIWALGVGVILGRIVSWTGLIIFTIWAAMRGGESPGQKGRDEAQGMAKSAFKRFLKKHWKKLSVEAMPIIGDISPTFLMMWYSELK